MKFAEKRLLQFLLNHSALQPNFIPLCSEQDFAGLVTERIFAALLSHARTGATATFESLHRHFAGESEQVMLAQLQIEEVPEDLTQDAAESFLCALRSIRLEARRQEIQARISAAAEKNDDGTLNQLIAERVQVDRELVNLSRK